MTESEKSTPGARATETQGPAPASKQPKAKKAASARKGKGRSQPGRVTTKGKAAGEPPSGNTGANTGASRGRVENLRPWKPGQSGNLAGRPKGAAGLAERIRRETKDCAEMVTVMLWIMRDENSKVAERIEAVKWLTDRAVGRVAERHELAGAEGTSGVMQLVW